MNLRCFSYLLTFLLLTATAPEGVSLAQAHAHDDTDHTTAIDEAPADSVSIGNKTPDPTSVEPYPVCAALLLNVPGWPVTSAPPLAEPPPRCLRRVFTKLHWFRRRVPRLRDDASDH